MMDNQYLEALLREQTLAPGSPEFKELQQRREEVKQLIRESFGSRLQSAREARKQKAP